MHVVSIGLQHWQYEKMEARQEGIVEPRQIGCGQLAFPAWPASGDTVY